MSIDGRVSLYPGLQRAASKIVLMLIESVSVTIV
jgi:hypothetical protein